MVGAPQINSFFFRVPGMGFSFEGISPGRNTHTMGNSPFIHPNHEFVPEALLTILNDFQKSLSLLSSLYKQEVESAHEKKKIARPLCTCKLLHTNNNIFYRIYIKHKMFDL